MNINLVGNASIERLKLSANGYEPLQIIQEQGTKYSNLSGGGMNKMEAMTQKNFLVKTLILAKKVRVIDSYKMPFKNLLN